MKWKTEGVQKLWDRYKYAVFVVLIGAGAAAMAEWEDADPRARKDGGDSGYSNGDGEYSRRHQWRRSGAGDADAGHRWRASTGSGHRVDVQRRYTGPLGLFQAIRDGFGGRRVQRRSGCDPAPLSNISRGIGGVSGRGPGTGEAGGDGGSIGADRTFRRPHHSGKMAVIIWRRKRPMSTRWKRNTVVATMAVLVCAAVALNWRYSGETAVQGGQDSDTKILGEATLVSGQDGEQEGSEENSSLPDETGVYTGSDYFASARLTRQQARTMPSLFFRRPQPRRARIWLRPMRPARASRCWLLIP